MQAVAANDEAQLAHNGHPEPNNVAMTPNPPPTSSRLDGHLRPTPRADPARLARAAHASFLLPSLTQEEAAGFAAQRRQLFQPWLRDSLDIAG